MILTKTQINNITRNIILDYIKSKKIVNTSYEDIVKHIPNDYLEDPEIKEELNSYPYNNDNLVDLVMVTACREFIKEVEGTRVKHHINKDFKIDFRTRVETCIKEAGNVIIDMDDDMRINNM